MSPCNFLLRAIDPGLALLPGYMVSDAARVLLMAIAGQESNWSVRRQAPDGPAVGYWQFQPNGVTGVQVAQGVLLQSVCDTLDIDVQAVWVAIRYNDLLACAVARLCLWSDPQALPLIDDAGGAFDCYLRNWKPGKPDQSRWSAAYATAVVTVAP